MSIAGIPPMSFWAALHERGDDPALIDLRHGTCMTYRQLSVATHAAASRLHSPDKRLVCLCMANDVEAIICYLGLLLAGHAVWLCGPMAHSVPAAGLIERYRPERVMWRNIQWPAALPRESYHEDDEIHGYRVARRIDADAVAHADLALLLSTSGSTGNSKLVRLSYGNVAVNARQISSALHFDPSEKILLSLPLQHTYGLSVLNSALSSGAALVVGTRTLMERGFWHWCQANGVTTLPVVPTMLQFMQTLPVTAIEISTLRKITISAAALEAATRDWLLSRYGPRHVQIFSMYGMTEATARISVLPSEEFAFHPQSVGRAVSSGSLAVLPSEEIVYRGPNVMMGYADDREDLLRGDTLEGCLHTGDLGRLDESGRLYITGRLSRLCKVLGLRINLADVERELANTAEVAAVGDNSTITLFHANADESQLQSATDDLAGRLRIPRATFVMRKVAALPRTASGKICYPQLRQHQ
jgi:long-chain acyl-CoA synthetase